MILIDLIKNKTYTLPDKKVIIDLTLRRSSRKRKRPDRFNYNDRKKIKTKS